jgi:multicomponent Na+:H+ antiporter subunit D
MITNFILFPILSHLITAILLIFCWQKIRIQRIISTIGNVVSIFACIALFVNTHLYGHLVLHTGNWKPPFGITFVSDLFSASMVLLTSIVGLCVGIFSTIGISTNRIKYGYFAIFHFLLMGLMGAFLTGDLFNLYVWFEIVIISSFVLLTLGGKKMQMEGSIKYVALNMLASSIFLTAIGILYGMTGSLNMADLANKVALIENRGLVNVTAILFFIGFGIKSAVFPLYFWLPSSYHTPPSSTAAIFGGLLTKMGIYAMLRVFTLIFIPDAFTAKLFIIIAIATMLTGAFGAMNKSSIRRMLSYLIVCHIGYLIAGLGLYSELALAGIVFYLFHDIIIKSNLFLISGIIYKIRSSTDIRRLGGLYKDYPKLSLLFIIVFLSLAGIPPLSGFWPKINLIQDAFNSNNYAVIFAIIFASFVTLLMVAKIWSEVFWKNTPKAESDVIKDDTFAPLPFIKKITLILPIIILTIVTLYIGFNAEYISQIANRIAHEMIDTSSYIDAVLKAGR